jgi:hypothetical protein
MAGIHVPGVGNENSFGFDISLNGPEELGNFRFQGLFPGRVKSSGDGWLSDHFLHPFGA